MARFFNREVVLGKGLKSRFKRTLRTLVTDEGALAFPQYTEEERDALPLVNGTAVYNTDADEVQAVIDGAWETIAPDY